MALQQRLNSPSAVFYSLMTVFPKKTAAKGDGAPAILNLDLLKSISRVVIPLTLNKTLFRNSTFLVKTLVSLVSQKAAGFVTKPAAENLVTKFKTAFKSLTASKQKSKAAIVIPPKAALSIN